MVFIHFVSRLGTLKILNFLELRRKEISMIQEIFKEKIAEQRLIEQEETEKKKKRELELANVLAKAEKDIEKLLEEAPPSAFAIPEKTLCAVVLKSASSDESKGDFTKKYNVYTGYKKCYLCGPKDEYKKVEFIGEITLQFTFVANNVDFSNLFKDIATMYKDNSETNTSLFFVFTDSEAE